MFHRKRPGAAKARLSILALATLVAAGPMAALAAPTLDLSAYKGKVVYLDFWASWCQPCKASFPYMERLKRLHASEGLVIVAVNLDHAKPRADAFLQAMNSDLDIVYDPKGDIAKAYGVKDMPTSLLIDRNGKVSFTHQGFYPEKTADYDVQVGELLHDH